MEARAGSSKLPEGARVTRRTARSEGMAVNVLRLAVRDRLDPTF